MSNSFILGKIYSEKITKLWSIAHLCPMYSTCDGVPLSYSTYVPLFLILVLLSFILHWVLSSSVCLLRRLLFADVCSGLIVSRSRKGFSYLCIALWEKQCTISNTYILANISSPFFKGFYPQQRHVNPLLVLSQDIWDGSKLVSVTRS
jgi:hypothetical protein